MATGMVATLSGRIGTRGRIVTVEVPADVWDRLRDAGHILDKNWDDIVTIATEGGTLPLTEAAVLEVLKDMERDLSADGVGPSVT